MIAARIVAHIIIVRTIRTNGTIAINTTITVINTTMIAMLTMDTTRATSAMLAMNMTAKIARAITTAITKI